MPMYQLPPLFSSNFDVSPKNIVYPMNSYHNFASQASSGQEKQESDPRKALELKQLELIDRLKAQTESLNKLLVSFGKAGKTENPAKKAENPVKTGEKDAPGAQKLDKNAKKEARKAAKAEAVKKVASGEAPAPKKSQKGAEPEQWKVEDDRKTWETNLSLTVNIPPNLVNYEPETMGEIGLSIRENDKKWVEILAKIGEKRGVSFVGDVKNSVKQAKTTVKVTKSQTPSLTIQKTTVKSLETMWKVLGAALGLFSRRAQQVLSASHQALWLARAEKILQGSGDLSYSTREASQFLARFDSLSSQWEISMADVIFRSLLSSGAALPNNVEIWAKKIDSLLI